MFGNLTAREIEQVLTGQIVGRIGCHFGGVTYVVPVSYAYDGKCVYCHAQEGLKISIMRQNRNVCFQTDHMEDMANWQSVIAWGEYEELTDPSGRNEAIQKLRERILPGITSETVHLTPQWPFSAEEADSVKGIIYKICLKEKTGRFERSSRSDYFGS